MASHNESSLPTINFQGYVGFRESYTCGTESIYFVRWFRVIANIKKSLKNLKANGNSVVRAFQKVQFLDAFRII